MDNLNPLWSIHELFFIKYSATSTTPEKKLYPYFRKDMANCRQYSFE